MKILTFSTPFPCANKPAHGKFAETRRRVDKYVNEARVWRARVRPGLLQKGCPQSLADAVDARAISGGGEK